MPAGEGKIRDIANTVKEVIETAHSFSELMQNQTLSGLQEFCGLTPLQATAIQDAAELIHDTTHVIDRSVIGAREILSCGTHIVHISTFAIV